MRLVQLLDLPRVLVTSVTINDLSMFENRSQGGRGWGCEPKASRASFPESKNILGSRPGCAGIIEVCGHFPDGGPGLSGPGFIRPSYKATA